MPKTYRPYVPEQDLLLPPSLREWLPEDHLAFFVSDLIDQLNLSGITTVYEDEERGYPPYHPVMLTKVLVYAYCVGVFSSRKIYNFTDPESRIMKGPDGFVQAYNVQVAVNVLQLIVGHAVTQETNDKKQLMPMITAIEQQSGDTPSELLADAGYCSDVNLAAIADTDIDACISTRKQKHGERPGPCPRGPLPKTATTVDRMSRKLHTKAGAGVYAARKGIVEPVIGQIKQVRGFRQFLLRGFEKVQGEWSLVCTTHNVLKLYRLCG
jgi:hypothetical protein